MKLKLIQVGIGAHGRGVGSHFVYPSNHFEYAGLVDIDPGCLEEGATLFNVPKDLLYTDYRKAFQEIDADAVLIEAASPVHYEICKVALSNNLHVLIEKPFVLKMDEAMELVEMGREKNLKIMINQNYRFYSTVLTLKDAIKEGKFGKPKFINAEFYFDHDGKPYQRKMEDYILMEMSVHHVDMIRFLLDCNISSVWGKTWNSLDEGYIGDSNVHAVYKTEVDIPVFYLGSLVSKGAMTPWEGNWRIQCERGSIHLDDLGEGYGVYSVDASQTVTKMPLQVPESEGIHGTLREFSNAIRKDREPIVSGRDNLNTLAALIATGHSSRTGELIRPSEFLEKRLRQ